MEKSGFECTQEFYDDWLKSYKATTDKFIEIPAVGPAREKSEKMMKGFSTFMKFYVSGMDTTSNLQAVFMEAMRKVKEKADRDMNGEITPEKYKEFYNIWIQTYGDTFKEYSRSDHFVADMVKLNSSYMDFQQYQKDMLEENYLKPMNLPTKKDIDDINKELYSLKKTVKELARQVKELKRE